MWPVGEDLLDGVRCDAFSLGVCLYRMYRPKRKLWARDEVTGSDVASVVRDDASLPEDLRRLLSRLMAPAEKRPTPEEALTDTYFTAAAPAPPLVPLKRKRSGDA